MNAALAKATAGELSQKEVDDIVGKALTNRQVYYRLISRFRGCVKPVLDTFLHQTHRRHDKSCLLS